MTGEEALMIEYAKQLRDYCRTITTTIGCDACPFSDGTYCTLRHYIDVRLGSVQDFSNRERGSAIVKIEPDDSRSLMALSHLQIIYDFCNIDDNPSSRSPKCKNCIFNGYYCNIRGNACDWKLDDIK